MNLIFRFLVAVSVLLSTLCVVRAQPEKIYRLGVLNIGRQADAQLMGLRDGLKDAGYIEGKNLLLEIPEKETYDELRPIAKTYVEKGFDVIVTVGGTATGIAKEATERIPIVFLGATQPVESGLVKSEAPGGKHYRTHQPHRC